ncbi:MAG: sugar transferase [Planctomycetota bacterium]
MDAGRAVMQASDGNVTKCLEQNPSSLHADSSDQTSEVYTRDVLIHRDIRPTPRLITACAAIHSPVYQRWKRRCDLAGAFVGLVVFSPILLLTMFLIWVVDGGPVIYRQKRVGINGTRFTMLKLRTMRRDADQQWEQMRDRNRHGDSITLKLDCDPRILPWVGNLFRQTSIDELPQLWNVLKGEMSLVGPRPALPMEVAEYDPEHLLRLATKPGLTCFWQVSGRGDLNFDQQFELDARYISECSPITDLKLLVRTIPALVVTRGAR